jgi:hypothetical protein
MRVRWQSVKQWWSTRGSHKSLDDAAITPADASIEAGKIDDCVTELSARVAPARSRRRSVRTSERTRLWRQRALLRKGARLYSNITVRSDFVSLAMLDEDGDVVAWFEHSSDREVAERPRIQGHVSQFYMSEDVALGIPVRDLCTATVHGSCIASGWRRGSDGAKFWASVVIKPILLRDGRLQGFSHTTHRASSPWRRADKTHPWPWNWFADSKAGKHQALGPSHNANALSVMRSHGRSSGRSKASVKLAAALVTFTAVGVPTFAAAEGAPVPEHARPNAYGRGWDCVHGYQRVNDTCAAILIPANAFLDASGHRWRCERGYLAQGERCAAIKVPTNAYLDDSYGAGWRCDRGFREVKGVCAPIQIPANARELDSSYGVGWECSHGYALTAGDCQQVQVPENGYLTRSGADWKCNRGFAKSDQKCIRITLPQHAYVDMQGNSWVCERGFRRTGATCAAIELPANAHLDYSGDRWQCNRGFHEQAGVCVTD